MLAKIGFSLSPGGLLLPYHMGALDSLKHYDFLQPDTPVAGSSAGAIAVAAHSAGLEGPDIVKATIAVSDKCALAGRARGNLLPHLEEELEERITDEKFQTLLRRPGVTGIAYKELFPNVRNMLQTDFESRQDLFQAVKASCHFPFFATNYPFLLDYHNRKIPRVVVDGFFTVPRNRMGIPDFDMVNTNRIALGEGDDEAVEEAAKETLSKIVDRTIGISCFPAKAVGMTAFDEHDYIAPGDHIEMGRIMELATDSSSEKDLWELYELGWKDAERWSLEERNRRTYPTFLDQGSELLN